MLQRRLGVQRTSQLAAWHCHAARWHRGRLVGQTSLPEGLRWYGWYFALREAPPAIGVCLRGKLDANGVSTAAKGPAQSTWQVAEQVGEGLTGPCSTNDAAGAAPAKKPASCYFSASPKRPGQPVPCCAAP